jgi:peptidoglycan/xylan/chitin deacetylase (PgdA/CDA1 family)
MHQAAITFALPLNDAVGDGLAQKLAGKMSRFLARHTHTKTLTLRNSAPMVSFTFDDVPASACGVGAAILEQYGARGTFYVAGGSCGGISPGGRLAAPDQLAALAAHGHEIGCHTFAHPAVSAIAQHELVADLERNHRFLHGIDGAIATRNFAYPYGDFSFRTKRYLEARFDSCRSLLRGVNQDVADLGALKTCPLENASIDRQDVSDFIARTVSSNGWLIFSSHDVASPPSRFGVTPDLLAFAAKAARDAGCRLTTIAEALTLAATDR